MPCQELFDQQSIHLRMKLSIKMFQLLLLKQVVLIVGKNILNHNMGIKTFGESAPYKEVYSHFNLQATKVVELAKKIIKQ